MSVINEEGRDEYLALLRLTYFSLFTVAPLNPIGFRAKTAAEVEL